MEHMEQLEHALALALVYDNTHYSPEDEESLEIMYIVITDKHTVEIQYSGYVGYETLVIDLVDVLEFMYNNPKPLKTSHNPDDRQEFSLSFRATRGSTFTDAEWAWIFKYFPYTKNEFSDHQYPDKSVPYVCIKDAQLKTSKGFTVGDFIWRDIQWFKDKLNELPAQLFNVAVHADSTGAYISIDLEGIDYNHRLTNPTTT